MRSPLLAVALLALLVGCDDPPPSRTPEPPTPPAVPEVPSTPTPDTTPEAPESHREEPPTLTVAQARQVRAHLREARAANRAGEMETALTAYRAAAAIDPDGRALCEMGWVLFQSEQQDAARDALSRGLAALPTHDPVPEGFVGPVGACLYNMGRLEEAAGNAALARQHYARSLAVRPGNRTVERRLSALPTDEGVAVAGGVPSCADGPQAFDLDAWIVEVRALEAPLSAFRAPLGRLGFGGFETFVDIQGMADGDESPLSATVTQVPLRLGNGAGVAVHVSLDDHMGGQFDGVAVLRSADAGLCRSGVIQESVDACSMSCLSDDPVFEMRTELVAADRDALRITTRTGACVCGSYRGGHHALRFHGVEGDTLVTYAEAVTYDGWYQSPWAPTRERSAEVTLGSRFPRSISIAQTVSCESCGEDLQAQIEEADGSERDRLETELFDACGDSLSTECNPGEETTTLTYRAGGYVEG